MPGVFVGFVFGIDSRKKNRIGTHDASEYIRSTLNRPCIAIKRSVHSEYHFRRRRDIHINISTQGELFQIDITVEIILFGYFQQAVVLIILRGDIKTGHLSTTA